MDVTSVRYSCFRNLEKKGLFDYLPVAADPSSFNCQSCGKNLNIQAGCCMEKGCLEGGCMAGGCMENGQL